MALPFGTYTEVQNRKSFARKDLAFKNYSVLTLCSLFHFGCGLVMEEEIIIFFYLSH